ncbi:MAG: hypothetical protein JWR26_4688 [Pedosphaera sp.]|nr:hypothetical protein [Pedosphaera sp.]
MESESPNHVTNAQFGGIASDVNTKTRLCLMWLRSVLHGALGMRIALALKKIFIFWT